jgi:hypothetical protein
MAEPTTRSALATRVTALKVELAELHSAAYKMGIGGVDAGTQRQKDAASGLHKRIGALQKDLSAAGANDLIAQLTA